jgi:hypothetical protein
MMRDKNQSWLASLIWDGSDQSNDGPRATSAISVAAARVGDDDDAAVIPLNDHNGYSARDGSEGTNTLISAGSSAASSHWPFSAATNLSFIPPTPRPTQNGSTVYLQRSRLKKFGKFGRFADQPQARGDH